RSALPFRPQNESGCRQRIIRGEKPRAEQWRNKRGARSAGRRSPHRRWPCPALRFALNAPPYVLRRATLRARPTTNKRRRTKNEKGDISNEVRKGTFLKSFDTSTTTSLTIVITFYKMQTPASLRSDD